MKPSQNTQIILSLINVSNRVHRKLGGALSAHGLGVSEFLVLLELENAPDERLRRVDLAEKVGLTASGVTRLLNPMEKVGLVEKAASSRDARVSFVSLSTAGKRTLGEAGVAVNDAAESLLGPLDAREQKNLAKLLLALA